MQDSNLKYYILVEGAKEGAAAFKLVGDAAKQAATAVSGTGTNAQGASKSIKDLNNTTNENANATNRAAKAQSNYFVHIAKTTVQSALVNKAFLSIVDAMGAAVKQADLIATFPASMVALGASSKDASDALVKLRQYVQGVGGDIGLATNAVARFVAVNKDVKASTAVFAGVNNALIAGGASADAQSGALEQLIQAYSRGRFEGEEWKSVNTAMTLAISETAKALGYVSTSSLQDALSEGKVSMNEFITELTKLSTEAGPISDQVALKMTGIEFAGTAMKNALVNGLTQIYMTVGRQNIVNFFSFLTQVITVLFQWVVQLINVFRWLFGLLTGQPMGDIAGDTAESLAAGATSASDLGNNLDDASKSAKKLRNQLASFDKMNVLTEPKDDDKDKGSGTAGPFSAAQAGELGKIFGDLDTKVQDISKWAKILAGIIAGIATLAALSTLLNWAVNFGKNLATAWDFAKKVGSAISTVAKWAWNAAVDGANLLGAYLKDAWLRAKDFVAVKWEQTKTAISNVVEKAKELGKVAWDNAKSGLEKIRDAAIDAGKKVKDVAVNMATTAASAVKNAAIAAAAWTKAAVTSAAAWLKQTAVMVAQFIVTAARAVVQAVIVAGAWVAAAVATAAAWVIANAAMLGIWGLIIAAIIGAVALIVANWDSIVNFFKGVWDAIVGFIKGVVDWVVNNWPLLLAIITGPIGLAILWIVQNWELVKQAFANAWEFIKKVFSVVGTWIYDNVIKPVVNFFTGLWDSIVKIFSVVGKWFGDIFSGAWDSVKRAFSGVGSFFMGIWDTIKNIFGSIGSAIGNAIGEAFKTVVNSIIGFAEGTINMFIKAINGAIGLINNIPGVNIKTLTELKIPRLATGGVVNQPTIAEIGENGAEAVVPLENNLEWIDRLASRINGNGGSGQATPDIIPVTNAKEQPTTQININVSGVLATSEQEKRKLAEMIAKQLEGQLRAKGLKGAF